MLGQWTKSEEKIMNALRQFDEIGNPKQIWITHTALADLYKRMNRSDLEREQWQKAAQLTDNTADGLQEKSLKEIFISSINFKHISWVRTWLISKCQQIT